VWVFDVQSGQCVRVLAELPEDHWIGLSPEGHYVRSPGAEKELVYVVETDAGQETLTPDEFSNRYGWKNDPENVRLVDGKAAPDTQPPPAKPQPSAGQKPDATGRKKAEPGKPEQPAKPRANPPPAAKKAG
jgi:hypothetical protein